MNNAHIEQLKQLVKVTYDGDVIGKDIRDDLVRKLLAQRAHGYNWLTQKGVEYLVNLKILVP